MFSFVTVQGTLSPVSDDSPGCQLVKGLGEGRGGEGRGWNVLIARGTPSYVTSVHVRTLPLVIPSSEVDTMVSTCFLPILAFSAA